MAAYDLVIPRWRTRGHRSPRRWDAFLDGYREVRPLPQHDVAAVPLFDALRHLWGMGLRAATVSHGARSPLTLACLDHRLVAFRRWEAEDPP